MTTQVTYYQPVQRLNYVSTTIHLDQVAPYVGYETEYKFNKVVKLLYELNDLEDPRIFRNNQIELQRGSGFLATLSERRTGKTTRRVIEAIAWSLLDYTVLFRPHGTYQEIRRIESLLDTYCNSFENPSVRGVITVAVNPGTYHYDKTIDDRY